MILNFSSFFADRIRLICKLRLSRIKNYFLILTSYFYSKLTGKVHVWGYPFSITLETASTCNLSCPECLAGIKLTHRDRELMEATLISEKLDIHQNNAFYCNLYAQGEPFLHHKLYDIIDMARRYNYYTVISTNGHFLSEENCIEIIISGLDRLIVSLDGIDPESYLKYRKGGNYQTVVDGIKRLSNIKKKLSKYNPLIVIQFLVHKGNEHQVKAAPKIIKALGADKMQFKSMQVYSRTGIEELVPDTGKYNRYRMANKKKQPKNQNSCFRIWSQAVYNSDGAMVPCCFDKIPEYSIGKTEKKRDDLWKSPQMQKFRQQVLSGAGEITICNNCI
jgi:radical SAM protein with 4Fe4S-binding SPASM domain